jgi:hypothetical protein
VAYESITTTNQKDTHVGNYAVELEQAVAFYSSEERRDYEERLAGVLDMDAELLAMNYICRSRGPSSESIYTATFQ